MIICFVAPPSTGVAEYPLHLDVNPRQSHVQYLARGPYLRKSLLGRVSPTLHLHGVDEQKDGAIRPLRRLSRGRLQRPQAFRV